MSLYLPPAFDAGDLAQLDRLAAEHPFASLVTMLEGEPFVSHLPVVYRRDGAGVELLGHLARPNLQAFHSGRALAILHGPNGYVSPTWYLDKHEQARVPTWNYVVAHLSGAFETFHDETRLADIVGRLSELHESRAGGDWRFDRANAAERVQLRGIVGVRLRVHRIAFKAKLSQNHPAANRVSVEQRLAESSDAGARALADWMRASRATTPEGA